MKRLGFTVLSCSIFVFIFLTMTHGEQGQDKASAENSPVLVFPEKVYKFDPVFEGMDVLHDFVIQNKGTANLDVKKVSGG